jgi:hypothetical protein
VQPRFFEEEIEVKTTKLGYFTATAAVLLAGLALSVAPAAAAKTIKACQAEWRADKVDMQAAGKTEKAYVAECRGLPAPTASAKPAAATKQPPAQDKGSAY